MSVNCCSFVIEGFFSAFPLHAPFGTCEDGEHKKLQGFTPEKNENNSRRHLVEDIRLKQDVKQNISLSRSFFLKFSLSLEKPAAT